MPTEAPDDRSRRPGSAPRRAAVRVLGSYAKALVMTAPRIPVRGETLIGSGYRETFGGKGSDMAVQAARLGADVDVVAVVGDDAFGTEFLTLMQVEGVGTGHVRRSAERPTGVGFIVKDTAGHNVIVVDMGANELFGADDLAAAFADGGRRDVVLAQLEIPLQTALDGLRAARAQGSTTVLNPAPAQDLREADLSAVDVLTPNQTEARVLLGLGPDDPVAEDELGERLLSLGAGAVLITMGEDGSRLYRRGAPGVRGDGTRVDVVPAWPVDVVDSNGAGDSFNAALAVALGEGADLLAAARFAAVVAALSCEGWETVPSYRHRPQVEAHMARRGGPAPAPDLQPAGGGV